VVLALEALADLQDILDWIAVAAGPRVAVQYVDRLEAYCDGLAFVSYRGQDRSDLRPGLRVVAFKRRITIAFRVSDDSVTVLRIFRAGRDWESLIRMT
jgi:toxin ParE1/3/4